jgi:glutamyl-tRNA synthetase
VDAYDVKMSTSAIKEKIEAGELDGWDDPRAPTVKSLRRRGIRGSAIVDAMLELGTSTSDVDLSMSAIYANNRDIVDDEATRYFLVREGERFAVEGGPEAGHPAIHPDHEDRGDRTVPAADGVVVEPADVPADGDRVWLKGFGCVRREDDSLVHTDDTIEVVRSGDVDVVHWAPAEDNVSVEMRTMDGDVTGVAEPDFADSEVDDVVQFERIGFVRVDSHGDESVVYWAHD